MIAAKTPAPWTPTLTEILAAAVEAIDEDWIHPRHVDRLGPPPIWIDGLSKAAAMHIATASPPTVARLVERIEALEEKLRRAGICDTCDNRFTPPADVRPPPTRCGECRGAPP